MLVNKSCEIEIGPAGRKNVEGGAGVRACGPRALGCPTLSQVHGQSAGPGPMPTWVLGRVTDKVRNPNICRESEGE